jgi:alkylation response protein AidB-like acyl-CoA dehydrogenase
MATATTTPRPSYLDILEPILTEIIAPAAGAIDRTAAYPQAALDALAQAGLLGLVSAKEVGGLGEGIRAATLVVEQIARHCASTALVVCIKQRQLLSRLMGHEQFEKRLLRAAQSRPWPFQKPGHAATSGRQ